MPYNQRFQYQIRTGPPDLSFLGTYRWFVPWVDPVRIRRAIQQNNVFVPFIASEVVTVDKWFKPLIDPVRKYNRASLTQVFVTDTNQIVPSFGYYNWFAEPVRKKPSVPYHAPFFFDIKQPIPPYDVYYPFSEPVRRKPRLIEADQPFIFEQNLVIFIDWFSPLSEPRRLKQGIGAYNQRFWEYTLGSAELINIDKWAYPWSEPVRFKLSLHPARNPFIFEQVDYAFHIDRWLLPLSEPKRFKSRLLEANQKAHFEPDMQPIPRSDSWWTVWLPQRPTGPGFKPTLNTNLQPFESFELHRQILHNYITADMSNPRFEYYGYPSNVSLNLPLNNEPFNDYSILNSPVSRFGGAFLSTSQYEYGASLLLDGSSGYLTIPDNPALRPTGDFTINVWVNSNIATGTRCVLAKCGSNVGAVGSYFIGQVAGSWTLYMSSDGVSWDIAQGVTDGKIFGAVTVGKWDNLTVSRVGNTYTMYFNGLVVVTFSSTKTMYQGTDSVSIGVRSNTIPSPVDWYAGYVNQLSIVNGIGDYFIPDFRFYNNNENFTISGPSFSTLTPDYPGTTFLEVGIDPGFRRVTVGPNGVGFPGASAPYIKLDLERLYRAPPPFDAWDGKVFYQTIGHPESSLYYNIIPDVWTGSSNIPPPNTGDRKVVLINMANLVAGGNDWINNNITGIRFDLSRASSIGVITGIWIIHEIAFGNLVNLGVTIDTEIYDIFEGQLVRYNYFKGARVAIIELKPDTGVSGVIETKRLPP